MSLLNLKKRRKHKHEGKKPVQFWHVNVLKYILEWWQHYLWKQRY